MLLPPARLSARVCAVACALVFGCAGSPELDTGCFEDAPGELQLALASRATVDARLDALPQTDVERLATLEAQFAAAGCRPPQLQRRPIGPGLEPNLVCALPGARADAIVVGAHYDKVAAGQGAVDNWSGASLLPSLYASAAARPRRHTFLFVGFAAEERGLLGSRAFVRALTQAGEQPVAMINLDSLGTGPTLAEVNRSDPGLVCQLRVAAALVDAPVQGMNVDRVGLTDSESFRSAGHRVLSLHSVTQASLPLLNSGRDRLQEVDRDHLYQSYRLIAALLTLLDTQLG